jgi:hypothetical protein
VVDELSESGRLRAVGDALAVGDPKR